MIGCSAVAMLFRSACRPGCRDAEGGPRMSLRPWLIRHRPHCPGCGWAGSLQVGQSCQMGRVVQCSQRGWSRVPETMAAVRPQEQHRAVRLWQAGHHGRPVVRDVPQGFSSPQIEHAAVGRGGQLTQTGPSGVRVLTGRRRPQLRQTSRLSGHSFHFTLLSMATKFSP